MTKTECIWLAGFIDGEGWFSIFPDKTSFRLEIGIESTNKEVIYWLNKEFGGFIRIRNHKNSPKRGNRKDTYTVRWNKYEEINNVIICIYPYIRIKRMQIEIFKKTIAVILKNKGNNIRVGIDWKIKSIISESRNQLVLLNKRGIGLTTKMPNILAA